MKSDRSHRRFLRSYSGACHRIDGEMPIIVYQQRSGHILFSDTCTYSSSLSHRHSCPLYRKNGNIFSSTCGQSFFSGFLV